MAQNSYAQESFHLAPGEALFLFTDGIPEARRHFRDSSFSIRTCDFTGDGGAAANHAGTHYTGEDSESLGMQRVQELVSAVFAGDQCRLIKHHTPPGEDKDLCFEFRACKP